MEAFTYLDYGILIIVALAAFKGFFNGFIRELFSAIGIVAGLFLASMNCVKFGAYLDANFNFMNFTTPIFNQILAWIIIFAVIQIVLGIISSTLSKIVGIFSLFGIIGKVLGALIAGFKVFVIISVIVFFVGRIDFVNTSKAFKDLISKSKIYPYSMQVASAISMIDLNKVNIDIDKITKDIKDKSQKAISSTNKIEDKVTSSVDAMLKEGKNFVDDATNKILK